MSNVLNAQAESYLPWKIDTDFRKIIKEKKGFPKQALFHICGWVDRSESYQLTWPNSRRHHDTHSGLFSLGKLKGAEEFVLKWPNSLDLSS